MDQADRNAMSRANLLIHLFAAALFVVGHLLLVAALFNNQFVICGWARSRYR